EAHAARLALRVYSVGVGEAGVIALEHDVDLDWDHGRRIIDTGRPGVRGAGAVGLRAPSGAFAPIAHRPAGPGPPPEAAAEAAVQWMEVAPARRRGAEFEPVVVVASGRERLVRAGASRWEGGVWQRPGARVPLPPGFHEPLVDGESDTSLGSSSPWLRCPG